MGLRDALHLVPNGDHENHAGMNSPQLARSYVWGMGWFIFSEVMFFAAFFGALFYVRQFAVPWLGGEGDKGIAGQYLWQGFSPEWATGTNPSPHLPGPAETMAAPSSASAWAGYLPLWNTIILLTSSVTVHFAHVGLKNRDRKKLISWLSLTVYSASSCSFRSRSTSTLTRNWARRSSPASTDRPSSS